MNYRISRFTTIAGLIASLSACFAIGTLDIGTYSLAAYGQANEQANEQTNESQPSEESLSEESLSEEPASVSCPAALDRMRNHTVASSDTLASVASNYRLASSTLTSFNPGIGSQLSPGSTLVIPPFNGRVVSVAAGESWQSLAKQYGSRADLLFEVNGCVADIPSRIFVPTLPDAAGEPVSISRPSNEQTLVYPLAEFATIVRGYGWQPHPTRDELVFNSGIAFNIVQPNEVLASTEGTVAFAGEQEGYGNLVVINHAQGLQTRYANLSNVSVSVGQAVETGAAIGSVGGGSESTFLYFEVRTNSASGWIAQDPGKYVPDLGLL
jgi:murein DD-endopeptidase MepM/ murein hydrolase activator NlpD